MLPPEGEKKYLEVIRNMSAEKRLKTTFELNRLVKKIMESGIRNQYPGISLEEYKNQVKLRT